MHDALQIFADSVYDFLNRFEYPTRASIYVALLDYAFVLVYFGGNNTMERSLSLKDVSSFVVSYFGKDKSKERSIPVQRIYALAPAASVSTEEVEKALNDAAKSFPYLLESAKGVFVGDLSGCLKSALAYESHVIAAGNILSFLSHVGTSMPSAYTTNQVVRKLCFSVSDLQQVNKAWDTIFNQMNLTEDQAVDIMNSAVLINYVGQTWLDLLTHQSDVPVGSS
jgi:hypothetical protein